VRKITKEFVKKVIEERKWKEEHAHLQRDLETYLSWLPYYKKRKDGGTTENPRCWGQEVVLFNATVFVDSPFNMVHQGDITVDTLIGIRKRLGKHSVYIFSEHNFHKPICGPWDLTALKPTGMAKPFGKKEIHLDFADIIIKPPGKCIITSTRVNPDKCKAAGFKVEVNLRW